MKGISCSSSVIKLFKVISPVPCVISFKYFGDLQNYIFLESLESTEPEK